MPVVYKLDTLGNVIWSTAEDALLNFEGSISTTFITADAIYAFGDYTNSIGTKYFLTRMDKQTGRLLYVRNDIQLNGQFLGREVNGKDSIRVLFATPDPSLGRSIVHGFSFSMATGEFASTPDLFSCGLDSPGVDVPIYFDALAAYYNVHELFMGSEIHYIKKKDRKKNSEIWRSPTDREYTSLYKDEGLAYFINNMSSIKCIADSSGEAVWYVYLRDKFRDNFTVTSFHTLGDTLYIAGNAMYTPSTADAALCKLNKKNGDIYWAGTIGSNDGIGSTDAHFRNPNIVVGELGDIYIAGNLYNRDERYIKKISGADGRQLYQLTVPVDTLSDQQFTVPPLDSHSPLISGFNVNGKPSFLLANRVTDGRHYGLHVNFFRFNSISGAFDRKLYDNNLYQYPSTVIDVQSFKDNFFIVRKVAAEVYVEKYKRTLEPVWCKRLTANEYFNPTNFAIDSTGDICIIGRSESSPFITVQSLSTSIDANIAFVLDSNGVLKKTHDGYSFWNHSGEFRQLIGDNSGFYLFLRDGYCHLTRFSVNGYSYTNFNEWPDTYAYFNGRETLNNIHSVVATNDSIFIYANHAPYKDAAFCLKISKIDGRTSKSVVATNGRHNGAFASRVYANTIYSFGAMRAGYSLSPALAKINSAGGSTQWVFSLSEFGTVTKCVEDGEGQLYALLRLSEDVLVTKLDANTGESIWTYRHPIASNIRSYDIDVSTENNTVIIALLKHSSDWKEQNSSFFILNASNGEFIKQESMDGAPNTQNNIMFIRNIAGVGILMGGNLNTDSLGGSNGFCMVRKDIAPYDPPVVCHLKPYFTFSAMDQTFSTIKFTNLTTGGRQPLSYSWNFNDGSNLVTTDNPQHRFNTTGVYQICLEVKDSLGCLEVYCEEISIPESTDTVDCNVKANFRYQQSNVAPGEIHFLNLSEPDTATYRWNFGDGSNRETSVNPIHLYAVGQKYQACLTTTSSQGCQQTFCDTINVLPTVVPLKTKASPNPATMELYLDFLSNHATNVEISCRNINGDQLYNTVTNVSLGINHIAIPVANFPPGIYFVAVSGNGIYLKTKFVKL